MIWQLQKLARCAHCEATFPNLLYNHKCGKAHAVRHCERSEAICGGCEALLVNCKAAYTLPAAVRSS